MVLIVTMTPPESSQVEHPLVIDTDNDEVTVGFDFYHWHFEWPSQDEEYGNPLRFIDDILHERIVIISFWSEVKWVLSTTLDVSKDIGELSNIPEAVTLAKVRSWNGTYSRNEALPLRGGSIGR